VSTAAPRTAAVERATRETRIACTLTIDGSGVVSVRTSLGFLDHMLTALATHARFDLDLSCHGDLHIDDHHTTEDCCLVLGQAIDRALGDRAGVERFGEASVPMDEALARASVDLVTRPYAVVELALVRDAIGQVACENLVHGLETLITNARLTAHIEVVRGRNDHHKAEAAFKALAVALRRAVLRTGTGQASTKGVL
jgi:imidazoleglycerol phosphate dehydratase HisB